MVLPSGDPRLQSTRPDARFIAGLVAVAGLILGIGASFRPHTQRPTTAVPSNELATLPELSQRRALRDMADYINERSISSAASVIYLPEHATSAVLVRPDTALTAIAPPADAPESERFHIVETALPGNTVGAVTRVAADSLRVRWALVVARAPGGQILSLSGLVGGRIPAACGDLALHQLVFDKAVPAAFRGGGVFDLDGNVVAMAVPCAERTLLVPLADVFSALEQQRTPGYQLWAALGFRAQPADSLRAGVVGAPGLLVTEVRLRSPAGRAGLEAGDRIVAVRSQSARALEDLVPLLEGEGPRGLVVQRSAGGVTLRPAAERAVVLERAPSATLARVAEVRPGSRAEEAGLRPGDRVLRIGRVRQPSAATVVRMLSDTTSQLLVYERDGTQRAVVLP